MNAVARPALPRLPLAAGLTGLLALLVTLLLGPSASSVPSAVLSGCAAALLLVELVRRGRLMLRDGLGHRVMLALLGVAVVAAAWSVVTEAVGVRFGLILALGLGGTALVMLSILQATEEADTHRTPWQTLIGRASSGGGDRARLRLLGPLLVGVLAMLAALRLVAGELTGITNGGPPGNVWLLTAVMLAVFFAGPGWVLRGLAQRLDERRRGAPVARDEQVVAAHLHDSVLQTLSLIQRSDDPSTMAQLARQQERSLRAWLAGRDESTAASLADAVRLVAHDVEDEQAGAVVEVVVAGDAPLDAAADAMVLAAREAMRNAVRHAGSPVRVLVEVEGDGVRRLYVRDTGAGFDLDTVAEERRGVRDAIMGRMEHAGGTATIDSGPSGTVITLQLPGSDPGETR